MRCFKIYKLNNLYEKLKQQLFWSTALRFIFEAYLELVLCVTIALLNFNWDSDNFSTQYSAVFTVIFAVAVLIMPLFSSIFYYCKIDSVEEHVFRKKYGTLYEGLKLDMEQNKRKHALIYPFLFIVRRLAFMVTVVFMASFTWAQISVQFASSLTMIFYYATVWPFENPMLTKLEIFNEVAAVLACYFMLCFTDWIGDPATRYSIGWLFIVLTCLHLGTHLALLIFNTYKTAKTKAKARFSKAKNTAAQEESQSKRQKYVKKSTQNPQSVVLGKKPY